MVDSGDARLVRFWRVGLGVARLQDRGCGAGRAAPCARHRAVTGRAVDRRLELQAAVVRSDDRVAEARGDRVVGFCETTVEQEAGAGKPAELLVVREMELDGSVEAGATAGKRAKG